MSFTSCLVVMLGGAVGTLARYLVSVFALPLNREFPWGTIAINVTGSFVIGFFGTLTLAEGRYPVSENLRLFVMVGLCGGYTTFSAFSLQTLELIRFGSPIRGAINIAVSVMLCLGAVALGHALGSSLNNGAIKIAQLDIEQDA